MLAHGQESLVGKRDKGVGTDSDESLTQLSGAKEPLHVKSCYSVAEVYCHFSLLDTLGSIIPIRIEHGYSRHVLLRGPQYLYPPPFLQLCFTLHYCENSHCK